MTPKFELALTLAALISTTAFAQSWTDDFTKCNMYRLVDWDCPEDTKKDGKRYTMIPATQRTENVAGYALDVTPWSTESQFWLKMEAYTPLLP